MGNDLIYRCDCNLFSPSAGTEEMIRDLMDKHALTWDRNLDDEYFDEDKIYDFACDLIQKCQNYIDSAETITNDEYLAFKCPECHTIYIEDGTNLYNSICPTCGIKRKKNKNDFKKFKCDKCGYEYLAEAEPQWDENYCFTYWESNCPKCNNLNEINDCYWR